MVDDCDEPGGAPQYDEGTRLFFDVGPGQRISVLRWGDGEPEAVFLHGRGQNAHTWTTVVDALRRPAIAIDLPGHGHSDWRDDHDYGSWPNADAIAQIVDEVARSAEVVVGMSLGGTTTMRLASKFPHLVRRVVIVDATPASRDSRPRLTPAQEGATALLEGPSEFASLSDIVRATAATMPDRSLESVRAGVLRNARERDDGTWVWRYDPRRPEKGSTPQDRNLLWEDLAAIKAPIMLVCAGRSGRVLEEDVAEFRRRQPATRVEVVAESGHSVQADQPQILGGLITEFLGVDPSS